MVFKTLIRHITLRRVNGTLTMQINYQSGILLSCFSASLHATCLSALAESTLDDSTMKMRHVKLLPIEKGLDFLPL